MGGSFGTISIAIIAIIAGFHLRNFLSATTALSSIGLGALKPLVAFGAEAGGRSRHNLRLLLVSLLAHSVHLLLGTHSSIITGLLLAADAVGLGLM